MLENESNKYQFFIRPRKFGKSLFLSLLTNYYDIRKTAKFERLFGDLYIGKNPTPRRNSYAVINFLIFQDLILPASMKLKNLSQIGYRKLFWPHLPNTAGYFWRWINRLKKTISQVRTKALSRCTRPRLLPYGSIGRIRCGATGARQSLPTWRIGVTN